MSLPEQLRRDSVPAEGGSLWGTPTRPARPDYRIDPESGCWVWLKALGRGGYPSGRAHRRYWEVAKGPIPPEHDIHHTCKNRRCVNPDHLEALHERAHDVEHFLTERTGLTLEDVKEIRRLGADPDNTADPIAARFGVSDFTIRAIWNGKRWAPELGATGPVLSLTKTCARPGCEEVFTGKMRSRRYCTPRCQRRHAYEKRKAA